MRILIFNFEYPPLGGGGAVATEHIAHYLALRHEVHVVTTMPNDISLRRSLSNLVSIPNLFVHRVPVLSRHNAPTASLISLITFVPSAFILGLRLTKRFHFSVINAQFVIPSGIPAAIISAVRSIPLVISFIGGDIYDPSRSISPHRHWCLRKIIQLVSRQATAFTAISNDTKERAAEIIGHNKNIMVVHLGFEPVSVPLTSRPSLGLPDHIPLFVSIGRLILRKGYLNLLRSWRLVHEAHLVIIGDGPQKKDLLDEAARLHLQNKVHFTGYVSDQIKWQILQVADGYVSASIHEGFGLVFLEAMEAGLPIIATKIGGHTDFLQPNVNALLVNSDDIQQLSTAVNQLITDNDLSARLGKNNRETVKLFYPDQTTAKFATILEQTAKHR